MEKSLSVNVVIFTMTKIREPLKSDGKQLARHAQEKVRGFDTTCTRTSHPEAESPISRPVRGFHRQT